MRWQVGFEPIKNTKPRGEAGDWDVVIDSVGGSREGEQAKTWDFLWSNGIYEINHEYKEELIRWSGVYHRQIGED